MESVNLSCFQGDNLILNITYKDPNGEPIDLSDFQVLSSVRDTFGGKTLCAECNRDDGVTLFEVDGTNGPVYAGIRINYVPAKTDRFSFPKAAIQVKIVSPDNTEKTIMYGTIEVRKPTVYG